MSGTTAPHAALQAASFVIAFTGEGAAAYVVHGGWEAMLARFAQETIGHTPADMAARTHPNHSEWCMWLESLTDPDEWSADEGNLPYCFSSEVGEISHVAIYRLSTDGVPACPGQFCDCGAGCLKPAAAGVQPPQGPSREWLLDMLLAVTHHPGALAEQEPRWLPVVQAELRRRVDGVKGPEHG